MNRNVFYFAVFFTLLPFCISSAVAQNSPQESGLSGTITDLTGYGVAGVRISAQSEDRPENREIMTTSAADGEYSLTVSPGRYRVLFQRPAFTEREVSVTLGAGERRSLDLLLQLERISENVVVTANVQPLESDRTPAPVEIISRQEIAQRQAVSLPDLLASQAGISITRLGAFGGLTTVFLDGGGSNFAKVLVDGSPVNEPGGAINFANFTVDNLDKIEIVHGAESALYGTDAMSGVIQLFTHRGATRIPEASIFAEGGSFSSARGGAEVSGLLHSFDYSLGSSYFHTDGQGTNDAFLNRTFSGNFGYGFSKFNQLRLTVRSNSSYAGIPGQTLLFPADPSASDNLQQLSANLRWTFETGSHWSHTVSAMEARIRDANAFPPFGTFTDQFNRAGFLGHSTYLFRHGAATAGYQYEVENGYPSSLGGLHARRNNQAGFLDARWLPIARLTLSAGARAESNANFGTRAVPRAGAAYALRYGHGFWGDTRARVSYGQGIGEPTMFESFSSDPCTPGNPSLRPERSRTFNAGVDQILASDGVRVSATYFNSQFRDLISTTPGASNPACPFGTGTFFNTDLSRARGMNFSAKTKIARWLQVSGNYSYDDTRVLRAPSAAFDVQAAGNRLLRRPVNSGNAMINAGYRRMNVNLAGYFTGVRTDSDFDGFGITRNPGYARFDVATSYRFMQGLSIYGRVTNLFDKNYQDAVGYPALGRDFRVGMNFRFGGQETLD